jgi:uncharacterized protein YjbI with pentapeptide repeats
VYRRYGLGGTRLDLMEAAGRDYRGQDLRLADLAYVNFFGTDLRGALLRGAVFFTTEMRNADFRGADLRGTWFRNFIEGRWERLMPELLRGVGAKWDETTLFGPWEE